MVKLLIYYEGVSMKEIDELLSIIKEYNEEETERVVKAYKFAKMAHDGQFRVSGEPYIIHPVNVVINLARFHADGATLVAGMLHDVVEDTKYTLDDIKKTFGNEVSELVDGVTLINNIHFSSLDAAKDANIRRIITSLNKDVRIIIIKLCDRLHNLKTLDSMSYEKQQRCCIETLSIYVPLAYFIGAFRLKCELEDICLSYLKPDIYKSLVKKREEIKKEYVKCIRETEEMISNILIENNISFNIRTRIINVYNIYRKMNKGYKINEIHDLVNIKLIVTNEDDCYKVLGLVHKCFPPINNKFKDYIAVPKTNMYRSLHTTIFGKNDKIIQIQIKTYQMDNINTYGLASYWNMYHELGAKKMQEELLNNYQFLNSINSLDDELTSDRSFIEKIKNEIFSNNIYVYTPKGNIVELPSESTPIDYAYKINTNMGNHLFKCFVNGEEVPFNYTLKNKDRVVLIVREKSHPYKKWISIAKTTYAKKKIKDYFKIQSK